MGDINNTLEIVLNLIYLARVSAEDAEKVTEYLTQAEDLALKLGIKLQATQALTSHG